LLAHSWALCYGRAPSNASAPDASVASANDGNISFHSPPHTVVETDCTHRLFAVFSDNQEQQKCSHRNPPDCVTANASAQASRSFLSLALTYYYCRFHLFLLVDREKHHLLPTPHRMDGRLSRVVARCCMRGRTRLNDLNGGQQEINELGLVQNELVASS